MRKLIMAAVAVAALVVPAASMASVNVDANGVGTIGKGDVQTALGFSNDNTFQAGANGISFSLAPNKVDYFARGMECGVVGSNGAFDMSTIHSFDADLGNVGTQARTPSITVLKSGAGKVTGYTANGVTTGASTIDWSKASAAIGNWSSACATAFPGERFAGWVDPSNVFGTGVVPATDNTLLVSGNGHTNVALPNTLS
jgi:hypothetical protein